MQSAIIEEKIRGVVDHITFHNQENGWSVLRVTPFRGYGEKITVTVHQMKVFAGATMEFTGSWTEHPRFGRQFKARLATEIKPATAGALEKYLGSGLIKGVGPKTARKIVRHFGGQTLEVFENEIERLTEVPGIAQKKLSLIKKAWQEHRAIREVMIFLQSHGISTLFAVRIYKQYGDRAIALVTENPYRLAVDFFGIGFFSADRVALSIGFARDSGLRIAAAIRHVLSASREQGHCYLTLEQISSQVGELLDLDLTATISSYLATMEQEQQLRVRQLPHPERAGETVRCYYSKSLFYDEEYVADRLSRMVRPLVFDANRASAWLERYGQKTGIVLSGEQAAAVRAIAGQRCAILTGGPGCGKTTTTRVLVDLLQAMGRSVTLAAPTGRAAQRMSEVIGLEARTIHRLLEFQGSRFKRDEESPLETDVLIVDECSMLDISLTASLLRAVAEETALLFIGDADQLPSVGAGNVLRDMIASGVVPCYRLTQIFRQARESLIIRYAHEINRGKLPAIDSPFKRPGVWQDSDCFFIDAEEASVRQLRFIGQVKRHFNSIDERERRAGARPYEFDTAETAEYGRGAGLQVPEPFRHVSLDALGTADSAAEELLAVLKKVHPWSSLYYGLTASAVVRKLYTEWIPKYLGPACEIQVLTPMIRGSLGSAALNRMIQQAVNPAGRGQAELISGERTYRAGDRVIHRRNNYELGVFNGDIGVIREVDNENLTCVVSFFPDNREVEYHREDIAELDMAYAITVHKAQGSEFDVVILPVLTQHYRMLFRNLIYTGLTRARKLAVFVGARRALAMAVRNQDTSLRQTALLHLLQTRRPGSGEKGSPI
ncbi:RecD-like DNA helicase YrrC [hydrothermal vent metagenome]|uniref:RecD-like DNA helicase YrrC n=1 Tax=hydrothermal vent metagenome TaxID=652676 RepID=A0A3B0VKJ6_9ZZZZ